MDLRVSRKTHNAPPTLSTRQRVVINTWWPEPTNVTFKALMANFSALDSAVEGCISAEVGQGFGDHTVGPNGSPDTTGETTLDALIVSRAPRIAPGPLLRSFFFTTPHPTPPSLRSMIV